MMLNHQKLTQPRITSKITEEQLKASSPGKSQTEDQIQTQEPAVQSQPEVSYIERDHGCISSNARLKGTQKFDSSC
ncbi:hypothetical protein Bca4012_043708 [Brassica carinata]